MNIEELKRQIMEELANADPDDEDIMEAIQKKMDEKVNAINHGAKEGFEGYSPTDMHYILYEPHDKKSPLRLNPLSKESYQKIPIFNLVQYLLNKLAEEGEVKLTKKGNLPVKWVLDLHDQNFRVDYAVEIFGEKIRKEDDSRSIQLSKILVELAGWVKKRKGKLSLSKLGERERKDDARLLKRLWRQYTVKYNWAYFDGYEDEEIGQRAFLFSLILLAKYGDKMRETSFYSEKYFDAFPIMLDAMIEIHGVPTGINFAYSCYTFRTFEHFMLDFGLIEMKRPKRRVYEDSQLKKTAFFDEWIKILPSLTQ